jgi:hypothetical protein
VDSLLERASRLPGFECTRDGSGKFLIATVRVATVQLMVTGLERAALAVTSMS